MGNETVQVDAEDYRKLRHENEMLRRENARWRAGLVPPPHVVADTPIPIPADDAPWVTQYPPEEGMRNCDLIRDTDVAIRCWRALAIGGQIPYHRGMLTEAWTFVHWWGSPAPVCTYKSFVGCPTPPPHYGQNKSQAATYERYIGEDREVQAALTKENHDD